MRAAILDSEFLINVRSLSFLHLTINARSMIEGLCLSFQAFICWLRVGSQLLLTPSFSNHIYSPKVPFQMSHDQVALSSLQAPLIGLLLSEINNKVEKNLLSFSSKYLVVDSAALDNSSILLC